MVQPTKLEEMPTKSRTWLEAECLKVACSILGEIQYIAIRRLRPNDGGPNWKVADIVPQPSLQTGVIVREALARLAGKYALADEH
jgi:hypothetical protein